MRAVGRDDDEHDDADGQQPKNDEADGERVHAPIVAGVYGNRVSSHNVETALMALRRLLVDDDFIDRGAGWTPMRPLDKSLHLCMVPFDDGLYRTLWGVADPARHPKLAGALTCSVSKVHTLDPPFDDEVQASGSLSLDAAHQFLR